MTYDELYKRYVDHLEAWRVNSAYHANQNELLKAEIIELKRTIEDAKKMTTYTDREELTDEIASLQKALWDIYHQLDGEIDSNEAIARSLSILDGVGVGP